MRERCRCSESKHPMHCIPSKLSSEDVEFELLEFERHVGDSIADNCVEALHVKHGVDALGVLQSYVARPEGEQISAGPKVFEKHITTIPDWVDWELVRKGQTVFWKYYLPMILVLFHTSLLGGFSFARTAKVLSCTRYFSTPERAYQRLLETIIFTLDCMKGTDSLQPHAGVGWRSIIRVRLLLQTQVRLRILALAKYHPHYYNVEGTGIPINQEDLLMTLCEFSIAVLLTMEKMGFTLSPEDVTAYLHLWKLIGYLMGVSSAILAFLTCKKEATRKYRCIREHLFHPDEGSVHLAHTLIQSVARKRPLFWSYCMHSAISRFLLGEKISDDLKLDATTWYYNLFVQSLFFLLRLSHSSTFFLGQRVYLSRKYFPGLLEAVLRSTGNWNSGSFSPRSTECNFALKFAPQI